MTYHTNDGPRRGLIRHGDRIDTLSVLEAPDRPIPIGMALATGWDDRGVSRFRLIVRGVELDGVSSTGPPSPPGPGSSD